MRRSLVGAILLTLGAAVADDACTSAWSRPRLAEWLELWREPDAAAVVHVMDDGEIDGAKFAALVEHASGTRGVDGLVELGVRRPAQLAAAWSKLREKCEAGTSSTTRGVHGAGAVVERKSVAALCATAMRMAK